MIEMVGNNTLVYQYTLDNEYPPPMLEYEPVQWIAYLMSAIFPLLAVRVLMVGRAIRAPWLCVAMLAPVLMFIALILRGAMGTTESDAFRMYETQTVLHLSAGFVLNGMLLVIAAKWIEKTRKSVVAQFLMHLALVYAVGAAVCVCVGVPLSFDKHEPRRISGYRLVTAALGVSLGVVVLGATLAAYHTDKRHTGQIAIVAAPAALLTAWMSFELARVSEPMHGTANSSDALFYCLSVLPAAGVLGVWTGMGEEVLGMGYGNGRCCCCGAACAQCEFEGRVQQGLSKYV
ncbi:hypothetical protein IWW36_003771 [Coemansia brasiliensis]|uniref:Uncharacterized protein n=1 Tax=Coemansia brasiliensis TaxID=2650707 RepID=A0A9W8IDE5_9FUNG|nr:hypothetical protein IWW36_003771 [Coemansia brasiliensis]